MEIGAYLAIENSALFIDLQLVIVVDTKPLEENLVLVGRHSTLISSQLPVLRIGRTIAHL